MWFLWTMLIGCGGPGECGVEECADVCAKLGPAEAPKPAAATAPAQKGGGLTTFEEGLVGPILEDLRGGVRPFGDEGIGVCKGSGKNCESFLGSSPGELAPGKHMLRAELAVPKSGPKGTWKVKFDIECTTTKKTESGSSTSTSTKSKEYTVIYAGEDRGYRLQPLWTIDSPSPHGAKDCKYKITAPHPDGEDNVYSGSWKVPDAG